MKKFSLYHIPILSFFSTALYRDVALNWKGICFVYLFLLLAACWVARAFDMHHEIAQFIDDEAPVIVSQIPTITIQNGQASIDEPQPYAITDPETGQMIAVIDTTGTITTLEQAGAPILLTKTQALFQKSDIETRTFNLSEVGDYILDQETINYWAGLTKSYLAPILYPFLLLAAFIYRIVFLLVYALIGMIFNAILNNNLTYPQLLRLSAVAITPSLIITTVLSLFDTPFPGVVSFLLAMIYLFIGIKVSKTFDEDNSGTEPDHG